MINHEWNTTIPYMGHPFALDLASLNPDPDFIIQKTDRIPFINCFVPREMLEFRMWYRQFKRMVGVSTLIEIFKNGSEIVWVHTRGRYYFAGKGIILDDTKQIIALVVVSNDYFENFDRSLSPTDDEIKRHFSLILNLDLLKKDEHRQLYSQLRHLFTQCNMDIIQTSNPGKDSFARLRIPRFRSISERQNFLHELQIGIINTILTSEVT